MGGWVYLRDVDVTIFLSRCKVFFLFSCVRPVHVGLYESVAAGAYGLSGVKAAGVRPCRVRRVGGMEEGRKGVEEQKLTSMNIGKPSKCVQISPMVNVAVGTPGD